ncbi:Coenzyme F390 synthetase [Candidatus Nitrospira nitrosa]|uniref:Coenzyme F390 synthetase n=1 Tax=Candidatus Nitrospira nitrosa TaxID=1742972 RepID=A0A0S4LAX5_9BACT|nr:Coenzyme F390 synthetase [Candidatus Nitrospira nitrosa]
MGKTFNQGRRRRSNVKGALLKAYHALPTPLRSVAASLRGFYLQSWRYGPETDRLVQEALTRESWAPDQWKVSQEERLRYVLCRAATQVPYYREQWVARRRAGDKASWEYLENWPILEKESLRENPRAFVADDCDVTQMFQEHTSGSTGKPLSLWQSRKTIRELYALNEARTLRWNGLSRHNRLAMVAGRLVTPVSQRKPPFWVWNQGLNQLYMSSYHLAPDLIGSYLEAISRYRVTYLSGYPSSLYALAQAGLGLGRKEVRMAVAITSAEPVYDYQRAAIAEAFNCPVRETYGMAEMVAMASECAFGWLHLWPEIGMVEVIQDGQSVSNGTSGELICTGLLNPDMPLIRYRVGDRGRLIDSAEVCQCGRTLPVLGSVEGRTGDVLYTKDGRQVSRFGAVFNGDLGLREAQIVQETLDCIRVNFVPTPAFNSDHERVIVQRLKERMGDIEVVMQPMTEIPRGPSGKFRIVICRLPKEDLPV